MNRWRTTSHEITTSLNLRYEPIGVSLYRESEALPVGIPITEENFKSYCQAVVLAGEGRTLLLRKEQLECKLGTSVLGFEQDMERFLDDGVLGKYGVGLYACGRWPNPSPCSRSHPDRNGLPEGSLSPPRGHEWFKVSL